MPKDKSKPANQPEPNPNPDGRPGPDAEKKSHIRQRRQDGTRETIESIVIAFILAFLFRTFEAEAFVIPTGSMAPTLYGRHKDVDCAQCGYRYRVGASFEVDDNEYLRGRMQTAVCPNCRYETSEEVVKDLPVFKGDRILVNKFPYEIGEPERWDVPVFKYPERPEINYIKRLVGLPGETIEVRHGDVYRLEEGEWKILRKDDANKQRQLQILVFDNDFPETPLHELGWPKRWAGVKPDNADDAIAGWSEDKSGWQEADGSKGFVLPAESTADGEYRWLRYRHFVPQDSDWRAAVAGVTPQKPRAELISDFCGYNAATGIGAGSMIDEGYFWVGDLTLNATVDIESLAASGPRELLLELVKGEFKYRCRIDLDTGVATLFRVATGDATGEEQPLQMGTTTTGQTRLRGTGKHTVSFANVDSRLCLWVDDDLVTFSTSTEITPEDVPLPRQGDLVPVGIAARGATVKVSKLMLQRDIYYRGDYLNPDIANSNAEPFQDSTVSEFPAAYNSLYPKRFEPEKWADSYLEKYNAWQRNNTYISRFVLGEDEFLMFGDNSPSSLDSRLWRNLRGAEHRYAVPRSALVGKAFFIYWPHGVPFMNDGHGYAVNIPFVDRLTYHKDGPGHVSAARYPSFKLPFYPQVDRMRRIR